MFILVLSPNLEDFHGIIISGLTEQTKLSFSSSNSSFTDCVRNPRTLLFSSNSASCSQLSYEDNYSINRVSCSTQGDYSFLRCSFFGDPNNIMAGHGGAICISNNEATLSVDYCQFYSFAVDGRGGAVYTENLTRVIVKNSLFDRCIPPSHQVGGAGAIRITNSSQPLIESCTFTSCSCLVDGGAVYIYLGGCSSNNAIVAQNSRFVCCKCTGEDRSDGSDGGGVMMWDNDPLIGVRNCLFSYCHSYKGGGIYLYLPDDNQLTPVQFCFFTKNSGTYGIDVFVHVEDDSCWEGIFSHSCTSGASNSLGQNHLYPVNIVNTWLPQANINPNLTRTESERGHPLSIII